MSKTKQLADRLGIVRRRKIESKLSGISSDDSEGKLKYLLVIDFESTCWKEKASSPPPEVIEFPVVVVCLSTGKVVAEFQQYVMPLENPRLSPFCTELTGIQQQQVDNGVPISTCLVLFSQWLREVSEKENFDVGLEATCLTWSDWDLKVCLDNECMRKQIRKPQVLCSWVDIRAVYREFYKRRPQGLNGALRELGLSFEGREHSGIEDARNTARLVWRMIQDGWKPLPDKPQDGWRAHLDKPQDGWRAHLDKPQLSTNRVAKPSTSGISRPSTSNVLKPSNCGISKPSGSGISRPPSSGISKPTSSNISRPSKAAISIPRSSGKSVPSNTEISIASNTATSKPSSTATSKPSSTATSKPSSNATSKPSTSTATAKCPNSRVANPSTVILSEKLSSAPKRPPSELNLVAICPVKIQSTVNTPSNKSLNNLVGTKSATRLISDSFKTPILKRTLGNVSMPLVKGKAPPNNATTPETTNLRQNIIPKYLNIPYKTPNRSSSSLLIPGQRPSPDGTPPFCHCGRRTRKHVAWRPGPNEGRTFFSCTLGSRQHNTGCKYFVWAEG